VIFISVQCFLKVRYRKEFCTLSGIDDNDDDVHIYRGMMMLNNDEKDVMHDGNITVPEYNDDVESSQSHIGSQLH
jgi:hypothetical protein